MRYNNLEHCLTVLKQKEEHQSDLVVRPVATTEEHPAEIVMNENGTIQLPTLSPSQIPMTEWAHGQLAQKLEIPRSYYNRMLKDDTALLSKNVNRWFRESNNILVRTEYGTARAILSSRYKVLQNRLVLATVINALETMHRPYITRSLSESDTTFYAKFVGQETYDIGTPEKPDLHRGGIVIRNSEVGASRLQVDLFVCRLSCGNDAIFSGDGVSRVHLGRKLDAGIIDFQSDTVEADNIALMKSVRDVVFTAFDPAGIQRIYDVIKLSKANSLEQTSQVVRQIQNQHKLSDELIDRLLASLMGRTQYDVAQSITYNAQSITNEDDRIKMEELGGSILTMNAKDFNKAYNKLNISTESQE